MKNLRPDSILGRAGKSSISQSLAVRGFFILDMIPKALPVKDGMVHLGNILLTFSAILNFFRERRSTCPAIGGG